MQNQFISTSRRIFLVKFHQSTEIFIVQDRQLFELIKSNKRMSPEYIKMSESHLPNFKRCAREFILNQFSYNTEAIEYFKKLSFFSGTKFNGKKL
jgi:hypothetical protein